MDLSQFAQEVVGEGSAISGRCQSPRPHLLELYYTLAINKMAYPFLVLCWLHIINYQVIGHGFVFKQHVDTIARD